MRRIIAPIAFVLALVLLPITQVWPFGLLDPSRQPLPQWGGDEADLSRLNADLDLKISQYVRLRQETAIAKGLQLKKAIHDIAYPPIKQGLLGNLKLFFGFGGAPKPANLPQPAQTPLLPKFLKKGRLPTLPPTEEARLASEIRVMIAQALSRVPADAGIRSPNQLSTSLLKHLAHAQNAAYLLETAPLGVDYFGGHNDLILRGSASGAIDFPIVNFIEAMADGDAGRALRSLSDLSELTVFSTGEDTLKADLGWTIAMMDSLRTLEGAGKKVYAVQLWNLSLPVSLHFADMAGTFTKKPASAMLFLVKDGGNFFGDEGGFLLRGLLESGGSSLNPEKFGGWLFDPSRGNLSKRMNADMWDFLHRFLINPGAKNEMCTLWEKSAFGQCPVGCNNQGAAPSLDADVSAALRGGSGPSAADLAGRGGGFAGAVSSGGETSLGGGWAGRTICGKGEQQSGGAGGLPQGRCNGRSLTSSGRGRFSIVPEEDRIMQAVLASVRGGTSVSFRAGDLAYMKSPMCRMKLSLVGGGDDTAGGTSGGETSGGSTGEPTTDDTTPEETVSSEVEELDETVTLDAGTAAVAGLIRSAVESIIPGGRGHDLRRGAEFGILRATIAYLQAGHVRVSSSSDTYEHGYAITRDSRGNEVVVIDQDTASSEPAHIQEVLLAATVALSIDLGVYEADGSRVNEATLMDRAQEVSDYVFDYRRSGGGFSCASESASCGPECSFMETQLSRFIEYLEDPQIPPTFRTGCNQGGIHCEGREEEGGFGAEAISACMPAMPLDPLGVCAQADVSCEGGLAAGHRSLSFMGGMDFNSCCSPGGSAAGRGTVMPGTGIGSPLLDPCRFARGGRCGGEETPGGQTTPGGEFTAGGGTGQF